MPLTIPPSAYANQISFTSVNGLASNNVNSGIDEAYSKSAKLASDNTLTGKQNIANTTASTSPTTGALVVSGGMGIGGDISVGGIILATIWTAPTLLNSFTSVGSPQQNIQYRKTATGDVEIRGTVARNSMPSSNTALFNLPLGFRPPLHVHSIFPYLSNTGEGLARISFDSSGNVTWWTSLITPSSSTSINLLFIQFRFSTLS
jgi:hypothetical protein